jgi:hypothetical protein
MILSSSGSSSRLILVRNGPKWEHFLRDSKEIDQDEKFVVRNWESRKRIGDDRLGGSENSESWAFL